MKIVVITILNLATGKVFDREYKADTESEAIKKYKSEFGGLQYFIVEVKVK